MAVHTEHCTPQFFRMSPIRYEIILAKISFSFGDRSTALAQGLNYSQLMH